ncbi:hypothetical protein [Sphingomonas sanxanigenens]|uniref:Uncharacterized protein n=1 Tax=Sphingomonas sanxanigenens DSM 19645 = NX02 TaxID=1123269 RepID=W0A1Q7_9SPHN|nr:hypothetical protein [Sphingomonas sanxanigenens]AHE51869.1 hypothetical protein NX02_00505 [Sphingomonas sanxanigenens DSM 19645 = NX02]
MAEANSVRPARSAARQRVWHDLLGLIVAPVPAAMLWVLDRLWRSGDVVSGPGDWFDAIIGLTAGAYGIALLFGLPVHELLCWRRRDAWWHYALGGAAVTVEMFLIFLAVASKPFAEELVMLPTIAAHVMPTALLFWLVAVRPRRKAAGSPPPT